MLILKGELNRFRVVVRPIVVQNYLKNHSDPKLHLGCGSKILPDWLNADKFAPYADIYLNAYRKLPFSTDTFKYIYMEHLIEHIKTDKMPFFLSELYRVLRPDGIVRLTCPDLEIFVRMYYENNLKFFESILKIYKEARKKNWKKYWLVRTKGGAFNTRAVRRFYHHRWLYDFETLNICLREIGFRNVIKQRFQKSLIEEFSPLDSESHKFETLYIDAVK